MKGRSGLVGRQTERDRIRDAIARARAGHGSLLLVAGEAGVCKTRLTEAVADDTDALVLRGGASQAVTAPYGSLVAALRSHLRLEPDALADGGPLTPHLAVLLPELGPRAATSDRATLFEAIRSAIAQLASDRHMLLVLDDLHWSDAATLDLLIGIAEPLRELPVVLLGTYRSD